MKCLLEVCLMAAVLSTTPLLLAQASAEIPMQRGISVDMPATHHAVALPEADKEDALVVAIKRDGGVWLGVDPIRVEDLAERVRATLSHRADQTLYIKADSRVPYANVIQVLDVLRTTGVERVSLLTGQRDPGETGQLVVPKGLAMRMVGTSSAVQR